MILLRKEAQEIFNNAGLKDVYLDVGTDASVNSLRLKLDCGETVGLVPNIVVPRKLTRAEREYAIEVIQEYVDKYKNAIKDSVNATREKSDLRLHKTYKDYGMHMSGGTYVLTNVGIAFSVATDEVKVNTTNFTTLDGLISVLQSPEVDRAVLHLENVISFNKKKAELQGIINRTLTCKL